MGGMLQHITFNEFLPRILGWNAIKLYGLDLKTSGYGQGKDRPTYRHDDQIPVFTLHEPLLIELYGLYDFCFKSYIICSILEYFDVSKSIEAFFKKIVFEPFFSFRVHGSNIR